MRVNEAGAVLDAEIDLEKVDGGVVFTMHSHSGASGGRPSRNTQYSDALRVILERPARLDGVLTDALVTSRAALDRWPDPDQRRLACGIPFPVRLADHDPDQLRRNLTEAMRRAARDPRLSRGGNNRRRTTFHVAIPGDPPLDRVEAFLRTGSPIADRAPACDRALRPLRSAPSVVGDPTRPGSHAQGHIADAAYRRAVELHAMSIAKEHFRSDWDVVDTSAHEPYDLLLSASGRVRFVEVKGTSGSGEAVQLTANEVEHIRRHRGEVVLFIVHDIRVDRSDPAVPKASGGAVRIIDPCDLDEGRLQPTAFTWTLPQ